MLQGVVGEVRAGAAAPVHDVGPVPQMAQRAVLATAGRHHGDLHRLLVRVLEPPCQPLLEAVIPGVGAAQLLDQRGEFGDAVDGDQIREREPVVLGEQLPHVAAPADDEADDARGPPFARSRAHGRAAEAGAHHFRLGDGVELHPFTAGPADAAPQGHAVIEALRVAGRRHLHAAPQPRFQRGGARLRARALQAQHRDVLTALGLRQPPAGQDTCGHGFELAVLRELQPHHGVRMTHHVRAGQRRVLVDEHAGAGDGTVRAPAPQPEPPVCA